MLDDEEEDEIVELDFDIPQKPYTDYDKLFICIKYVESVIETYRDIKFPADEKRSMTHDVLCDIFDYNRAPINPITNNLDVWIGLPDKIKFPNRSSVDRFGKKLKDIFESDIVKNQNWHEINDLTREKIKEFWEK